MVPCGFDAGSSDPLGRMMVSSETYREMAQRVLALAEELCGGRLVLCHEGRYSAAQVPFYAHAVLEVLTGSNTIVEDPYLEVAEAQGGHQLYPHQAAVIEAAAALAESV